VKEKNSKIRFVELKGKRKGGRRGRKLQFIVLHNLDFYTT
jgi:hypothetical protein